MRELQHDARFCELRHAATATVNIHDRTEEDDLIMVRLIRRKVEDLPDEYTDKTQLDQASFDVWQDEMEATANKMKESLSPEDFAVWLECSREAGTEFVDD